MPPVAAHPGGALARDPERPNRYDNQVAWARFYLFKDVHSDFGGARDEAGEDPSTDTIESGEVNPE